MKAARAGPPCTKYMGAPGHRTHTQDANWSGTSLPGQALDVRWQEDGIGKGAVPSPTRTWEVSTEQNLTRGIRKTASHVPEHGLGSLRVLSY